MSFARSPRTEPTSTTARAPSLVLTVVGELLWAGAYAAGAIAAVGTGKVAFPIPATVLNISWEAAFLFWRPPARRITRALYGVWFALDLVLLGQAWMWAWRLPPGHPLYVSGLVSIALGLVAAFALHAVLYRRFRKANLEAFAINAVMSLLFVWTILFHPQHLVASPVVAVLKLLGTGLISVANLVSWRSSGSRLPKGPSTVMLVIASMDLVYLLLILAR